MGPPEGGKGVVDTIGQALLLIAKSIEWAHQSIGGYRSMIFVGPCCLLPNVSNGPTTGWEMCQGHRGGPSECGDEARSISLVRPFTLVLITSYGHTRVWGRGSIDIVILALSICGAGVVWTHQRVGKIDQALIISAESMA